MNRRDLLAMCLAAPLARLAAENRKLTAGWTREDERAYKVSAMQRDIIKNVRAIERDDYTAFTWEEA